MMVNKNKNIIILMYLFLMSSLIRKMELWLLLDEYALNLSDQGVLDAFFHPQKIENNNKNALKIRKIKEADMQITQFLSFVLLISCRALVSACFLQFIHRRCHD